MDALGGLLRALLAITACAALGVTGFAAPAGAKVSGPNGKGISGRFEKAGAPGRSTGASAGSGAQLWVKRYNGPGNGDDKAHSVAASSGGQVVVTGHSLGSSGVDDYATVAYSG